MIEIIKKWKILVLAVFIAFLLAGGMFVLNRVPESKIEATVWLGGIENDRGKIIPVVSAGGLLSFLAEKDLPQILVESSASQLRASFWNFSTTESNQSILISANIPESLKVQAQDIQEKLVQTTLNRTLDAQKSYLDALGARVSVLDERIAKLSANVRSVDTLLDKMEEMENQLLSRLQRAADASVSLQPLATQHLLDSLTAHQTERAQLYSLADNSLNELARMQDERAELIAELKKSDAPSLVGKITLTPIERSMGVGMSILVFSFLGLIWGLAFAIVAEAIKLNLPGRLIIQKNSK